MDDQYFDACIKLITYGDREGLKRIYDAYAPMIYHSILAMVKHRENAEDLTSEFFIKLWHIAPSYKPGGGHRAWLLTVAKNMTMDFFRTSDKKSASDPFEDLKSLKADEQHDPLETVVGRISFDEAMSLLDTNERMILNLKILGGYTFREIADFLEIPMGTASWKYQQGIKKLRRADDGR